MCWIVSEAEQSTAWIRILVLQLREFRFSTLSCGANPCPLVVVDRIEHERFFDPGSMVPLSAPDSIRS